MPGQAICDHQSMVITPEFEDEVAMKVAGRGSQFINFLKVSDIDQ
jgi:hypothetical protein